MMEAAGITLREAVEAILVIFIMASYVERMGEAWKKKYIYYGAIAAILASVAIAFLLSSVGADPENELAEGIMFFIASILVGSLVVWMWVKSKHIKREIEEKVQRTTGFLGLAAVSFFMVFREGVETVIFLQSLLLTGDRPVENFAGALLGIALAVIFGFVFMRGTARINLARFFRITSAVLALLVVQLIANGFHEFFELGVIPTSDEVMNFVGLLTRDDVSAGFIVLMLAALTFSVVYDVLKAGLPDLSGMKPAERRKVKYELLKEKYFKTGVGAGVLMLVAIIFYPVMTSAGLYDPEPIEVVAENGTIVLPIPQEDGFYKFKYGEAEVLMLLLGENLYVALDDCYICPPKGYAYDGETLVCLNCNAPIVPETIGVPGGCNPVAINYRVEGGNVVIDVGEIPNWWNA
jgi:FTR1 family protein